jgi:hypothetical protein
LISRIPSAALILALATAIAAALAADAQAAGCPADARLVTSMVGTLNKSYPLSQQGLGLLNQIVALQSSGQSPPPVLLANLRSNTDANRRVIANGEKALARLAPGTPEGRTFRTRATHYLHDALRTTNECLADSVDAKTVAETGAVVRCMHASQRKSVTLQVKVNAAIAGLKKTTRCTLRR